MQSLSSALFSLRAIAKVHGVNVATVHRALGTNDQNDPRGPGRCRGVCAGAWTGREEVPASTTANGNRVLDLR